MLPHPPFGHLLPLKETGEGSVHEPSPAFRREKVPEGRMRAFCYGTNTVVPVVFRAAMSAWACAASAKA
jgi:hypothetical protein